MRTYITNYKWRWILALMLTFGGLLLLSASPPSNVATAKLPQPKSGPTERTATHIVNAPTAATFSAPVELVRPRSPIFFQQGGEPEIKVDNFGNIYVTAIQGVPAASISGNRTIMVRASFFLDNPMERRIIVPPFRSAPVSVAATIRSMFLPAASSTSRALWLGNVTLSTSYDGGTGGVQPGQKWEVHPAAAGLPSDDRQWVAAYGPQTINMTWATTSVTNPPGGIGLFFDKSTDGGKTFSAPVEITPTTTLNSVDVEGNLVVDPVQRQPLHGNIPSTKLQHNQPFPLDRRRRNLGYDDGIHWPGGDR